MPALARLAAGAALVLLHVSASVPVHLRGVPKSMEPTYAGQGGKFTCLDKSATVDLSRVNDEYCDCADGSDEPGTSACPNSRFYCTNKGYRGKYIPSMFVNDGVCDCCDGSDEQESRAKCPNTCDVDGAAWRVLQQQSISAAEEGARARMAYSQAGQEAARARKAKLATAQATHEGAVRRKEGAEAAVAAAESAEKAETASRRTALAANGGGAVTAALGLTGLDKDGAVAMVSARWQG